MALNPGASAGAIRAGQAFVEMFLRDDKINKSLAGLRSTLFSFAKGSAGLGSAIAAPGVAIIGSIGAAFNELLERNDNIAKGSVRIGDNAENYSALAYAAQQSGTSIQAVEKATLKMSQAVAGNAPEFKKLGIEVSQFSKLSRPEQFALLAEKLQNVQNPSARAAIAMKLLGKGAAELAPLMAGGADGIRELIREADRVGSVVSDEDAKAAERFGDAVDRAYTVAKNAVFSVASALLGTTDAFEEYVFAFVDSIRAVKTFLDNNRELVRVFLAVAAGFVAVGSALIALGAAFGATGFAITGASIVFGVLSSVVSALIVPVGALVLLVGSAIVFLYRFAESGEEVNSVFGNMGKTIGKTFKDIFVALRNGDFKGAFTIALDGMSSVWDDTITLMGLAWDGFWKKLGLEELGRQVKSVFGEVGVFAVNQAKIVGETFAGMASAVGDTLGGIFDALVGQDLELVLKIATQGLEVIWLELVLGFQKALAEFKGYFVDSWHEIARDAELIFNDMAYAIAGVFVDIVNTMRNSFGSMFDKIISVMSRFPSIFGAITSQLAKTANEIVIGGVDRESLERDRKAVAEALKKEFEAAQKAREAARGEDIAAAQANLDKAKSALQDSLEAARKARASRSGLSSSVAPEVAALEKVFGEARGLFDATNFKAQFAIGNDPDKKKQLKAAEDTADNTADIAEKLDSLPIAVWG